MHWHLLLRLVVIKEHCRDRQGRNRRAFPIAVFALFAFLSHVVAIQSSQAGRELNSAAAGHAERAGRALGSVSQQLCALQLGSWCTDYNNQQPVPFKPPPRGNKPCADDCKQGGVCDYDTGRCYCAAGWTGADCAVPRKRPCDNMGEDKRDINLMGTSGWKHSRCSGICDDDYAMCYCPPETPYGHVPAPPGSPLGTPPVKQGRPMYMCNLGTNQQGAPIRWAPVWAAWKYDEIYGNTTGYCQVERPPRPCHCTRDGLSGAYCDEPSEMVCPNQCSGRGECLLGFCVCHKGHYGHDCSRTRLGVQVQPDDLQSGRKPFLASVLTPVAAAQDPPPSPVRKRPLVYVYELSPEFGSDVLQFRQYRGACVYRQFGSANDTHLTFNAYTLEPIMHELFLTTEHRTFDPEEADFFYVPHYATCMFEVWSTNPIPQWPRPGEFAEAGRPFLAANMLVAAQKWIAQTFPYFNRSGGADHIWLMAHDEGACYAPIHIWPGVILSPWGRMDPPPHKSQTSYHHDQYSREYKHPTLPGGWLSFTSHAHPCYDPVKDLVLPVFKDPHHYSQSPYLGGQRFKRDILMFFRGDMGEGKQEDLYGCVYSRCIRQRLLKLSKEQAWNKTTVWYGRSNDVRGDYTNILSRSVFCLVIPGDGWSARFPDAMLHGCIPVIIQDNTHGPYENIIDYSKFSLRHKESELASLMATLEAVTPERIKQLQDGVNSVWQRFRFMGLTSIDRAAQGHYRAETAAGQAGHEFATSRSEDGFDTVMQFLHSRIPHVTEARRKVAAAAATAALVSAEAPAVAAAVVAPLPSSQGAAAGGTAAPSGQDTPIATGGSLVTGSGVASTRPVSGISSYFSAGWVNASGTLLWPSVDGPFVETDDFVVNKLTAVEFVSVLVYVSVVGVLLVIMAVVLRLRVPVGRIVSTISGLVGSRGRASTGH